MTTSPQVARMGFVSREDQNRACREIILRQHRATPDEMGRGREALMNGIEACHRAALLRKKLGIKGTYKPEVYLGKHPTYPNLFCIADNGCGMSFDEAERHLASIGNSGNAIAYADGTELFRFDTNKGVGVKISLLPDNPGGLDYVSVPVAQPADKEVWWFKLGMDSQQFPGFIHLGPEDGYSSEELSTAVNLDWDEQQTATLNFEHIQKAGHGTVLTLYGNDRTGNSDTADNGSIFLVRTSPRSTKPENDYSLLSYINKRFWELDVKVSVNLGSDMKQAVGAKKFLDKAKDHNTVHLLMPDGEPVAVHWWILRIGAGSDVTKRHNKEWARSGHVAIKYKNELYWDPMAPYQSHKKELRNFGIYAGHDSIAIYVDLDSLSDKATNHLSTNESRSRLFYRQQQLDAATTHLGDQFVELLNSKDERVLRLVEYMDGEIAPQCEDSQSDDKLKKLLKSLNLFSPIEKLIKHAHAGDKIATAEAEQQEGRPDHHTRTPIKNKAEKAPFTPKGNSANGIEEWSNELPRFIWDDEINPAQSVAYSRNVVTCFSQCSRFQFLLKSTLHRVRKDGINVPEGQIVETTERHLREAVKGQILSYIYVTAGFAKASKINFLAMQREACEENILEAQLMLNAAVQDQLTRAIQKELTNGK